MIVVISFCIKNTDKSVYFHFKGNFLGHKISAIEVMGENNIFEMREEYLLKLKVMRIEKSVLICQLIQSKKLEGLSLI